MLLYVGVEAGERGVAAHCGRAGGQAAADRESAHDAKQSPGRAQVRTPLPPHKHTHPLPLCIVMLLFSCVVYIYFLLVSGRDERDESNRQMGELRERLQARENDNARELKRREKTQKELQDVRSKFDEEMKVEEQVRYITILHTYSLPTILASQVDR